MKELFGDIWNYYKPHQRNTFLVFTTNGSIRKDGLAVMGAGIAKEVAERFPHIQTDLAKRLKSFGNNVFLFWNEKLISMPVKHHWSEEADPDLIEWGCKQLIGVINSVNFVNAIVYLVRPGCGRGQLLWKDVKPILEKYLDDRFTVVEKKRER